MNSSRSTSPARPSVPRRWQLRVLNGPHFGTTYPVDELLAIGRDPASDLQLMAQEVSRHHARIEEHEHGGHVLLDLGSSNGTYVDGELVRRLVLQPHAEITIADVELVYEPVPRHPEPDPAPSLDLVQAPLMAARRHAPTTPVGVAVPAGAIRDRSGHALVFEPSEGGAYVGNLFADIVEYRMLRAQKLRGGLGDPTRASSFERLKAKLEQPPPTGAMHAPRVCRRFGCWSVARIGLPSDEELPCHVCEVGVDGARLVAQAPGLAVGDSVRLSIDVLEGGERRSLVLPGRVAWTDDELVGMDFSGAPRREDGGYARQYVRPSLAVDTEEPTSQMIRPPDPVAR